MERNTDGPARPEQRDEGFETGQERPGHTIEEELEPNFARGQSEEPVPGTEHHGDFARGQEHSPDTRVERRFSEGQEENPKSR
jgi:hypothetical protein